MNWPYIQMPTGSAHSALFRVFEVSSLVHGPWPIVHSQKYQLLWTMVYRLRTKMLCRTSYTPIFHRAAWPGGDLVGHLLYMIGYYRFHIFAALVLNRKLYRLRCGLGAEIIHTCFEALLPGVKMHRGKFGSIW